jgi:predicted nucleic acid-binding protein
VTLLLDANVLVALCAADHLHHDLTAAWFAQTREPFATIPTQGSALRFLLREGVEAAGALEVLGSVTGHRRHEFWPGDVPFTTETLRGVIGHRQVTDATLRTRRDGEAARSSRSTKDWSRSMLT